MTVENKTLLQDDMEAQLANSFTEVLQKPYISHNHPESLIDLFHTLSSHIYMPPSKINMVLIPSEWY